MELFLLPSKINYKKGSNANEAILEIEPLYFGYGTTIGNALRRVLLSSLPGAAVTSVKIKGADQEFSSVDNVKEDALNIMLNLKNLRVKIHTDEPVVLTLKAKGEKVVTAKDISKNSDVEVVNTDLAIATLTDKKAELEMEITVQKGRGYLPVEERNKDDVTIGTMLVDAVFSPIRNVGYKVEHTRVGDITDYDKLTMTIETDGSITPQEAVEQSTEILINHFQLLVNGKKQAEEPADASIEESEEATAEKE
ncbi:DNA-directed RNA polymerase subunit alpha [Candidatus Falkowbacteria bacterium RIFOXYD2_FULL_35_9]|uniref:DNA-directed RNA polymerase subunit alpha n=1 Tax=Candidatus Falkowbacteria bacterium RIFOXYC2_FULL_36_12 TaxID=1798002 RepID=A0A1F5SYC0_9BACT|nr:MAG: DNA-directed RNA polymerase subunit alpha [Candidatus Falkowbacteria bacterium RIFOXYB2_FULL_35_7]OGF31715.1 MAG: DNA-directed RNA polymerase subunit alpha [Candidatus Falkowbacteria bacterium RIFOXYC2_FULL_36_12]OGF33160.1 MAG: DNA-directed RNA polymerase subunit alpha [Candidatus Falkowbacteria bacterium RIFOXYA2_FULL_35_8]OGF46194.1 MAG: DNA-directed RNA polymerase subunit alpha [Candidatus Falkowbacteria bacterium RIFOXYD2_FULL_35_9]